MKYILKSICEACDYDEKKMSMLLNLSEAEMEEIDSGKRELNEREVFVLTDKFKLSESLLKEGKADESKVADKRVRFRLDKHEANQKALEERMEVINLFVQNGFKSETGFIDILFNDRNEYKGADLVEKVDDYKLFSFIYKNFKMEPGSLIVFYDSGAITSKLVSDGPYTNTYNGGHRMVTYGEHEEGGRGGVEYRIVEDRGIYYEGTIEDLFFKNNPSVKKFRKEWNKEHNVGEYANDLLSGELSKKEAEELLDILEKNKVHLEADKVLRILLIDYLKRHK